MELANYEQALFNEISDLIERSRRTAYAQVNSITVLLFWQIGRRINNEILKNKRADYGKQIVVALSRQLTEKYGRSFEEKNMLETQERLERRKLLPPGDSNSEDDIERIDADE